MRNLPEALPINAPTANGSRLTSGTATPLLFAAYVQDSIRASDRLSIDIGLRADWSRLLVHESQLSPRLGLSYLFPSTQTTL